MLKLVGETAGRVWHFLKENGEKSVTQLKEVESNQLLLNLALGWLAREDKVNLEKKGNVVKVTLK
ncbi:winged helix-turn-helix domain-containing protein [candidate division KSB1 bacterium]|nr:winged helix-turn-helix domain-containing protein [candidate division KSB1 bacterium]